MYHWTLWGSAVQHTRTYVHCVRLTYNLVTNISWYQTQLIDHANHNWVRLWFLATSGNSTPGRRCYSEFIDTWTDSVCIHQPGFQLLPNMCMCKVRFLTISKFVTNHFMFIVSGNSTPGRMCYSEFVDIWTDSVCIHLSPRSKTVIIT